MRPFQAAVLAFLLLSTGLLHAQESPLSSPDRWTVFRDSVATGSAPVRLEGQMLFVDALSLADALGIAYYRDEADRYVFKFPGAPVVFVPDGTFAQVGLDILHFPLPAYREGFRFYVPEETFLDVVEQFTPGEASLDYDQRRIDYTPPEQDVLNVVSSLDGTSWSWSLTLARPLTGTIALADSTHIALTLDGALLTGDPIPVDGDSLAAQELSWDPDTPGALIETPGPIASARLVGPDAGNRLTLEVTLADSSDEPASPHAYGERDIFDVLEEDRERWKIDKIIIDPGHGGEDPGAIGRRHTREKNIALDIGLQLRDDLRKRLPDVAVEMTRDTDVFIPLGERTRIANRKQGKLFISIHCNSNENRRARGQETYFLAPARTERAMKVALKENAVIKYEEHKENYPDLSEENFILLAMAQSQFGKESEEFAAMIQSRMQHRTGLKNRGVNQAGFYVLIGASMPAVLVETAFISNPHEENLLRTKAFRGKIADGICDAVEQFIATYGE